MNKDKAKAPTKDNQAAEDPSPWPQRASRLHCRVGWWSLLLFLTLGSVLEVLFWLKLDWYVDAANETRRLMWRLAHAHGTLLGLIHLGFGITLNILQPTRELFGKISSRCLLAAGLLLPGGFVLGGLVVYGGDPGIGILLVPVGAVFLFIAVLLSALFSSVPAQNSEAELPSSPQ